MVIKRLQRLLGKQHSGIDFDGVRDARKRRGRRWTKQALLTATFVGLIAIRTTLRGIERLTEQMSGGVRRRFGLGRRVPDSTLARFWSGQRDEAGLRRMFVRHVRTLERRKALVATRAPIDMVAIDGKTIWTGTHRLDDPACQKQEQDGRSYYRMHTLHAVLVSAASQPVLGQHLVPAKTNEMGAFADFVGWLLSTYGRACWMRELISVDAGMVSAEHAKLLNDAGVGYKMAVKETQPTLLRELERLCGRGAGGRLDPEWRTEESYRGKRIRRELFRSPEIAGWPAWESVRQGWRVKQTTEHADGRIEVEDRYFVTNLPWGRLSGADILTVVRLHWGIENGCHWTLDVVMEQDSRPLCAQGKAVRMLSWMRLLAYNVLRQLRDRSLRSQANREMPWAELREWLQAVFYTGVAWGELVNEAAQADN